MSEQQQDNRLTTRDIALQAWSLAERFGEPLGIESHETIATDRLDHIEQQVLKLFHEASNKDHLGAIARQHDNDVAVKLRDGWKFGPLNTDEKTHPELLPFSQLPLAIQLKAQFFRTVALSFLPVWKMH
jgi:hypothetical protein